MDRQDRHALKLLRFYLDAKTDKRRRRVRQAVRALSPDSRTLFAAFLTAIRLRVWEENDD